MNAEISKRLPVGELDVAEIEDWLEQMALQGYFLDDIALFWWHFNRKEPKEVRYRLDLEGAKKGRIEAQKREDYEALGWHYVYTHGDYYHIFMTDDPGVEELHTDPIVESMVLRKLEKRLSGIFALLFYIGLMQGLNLRSAHMGFLELVNYPLLFFTSQDVWTIFGYLFICCWFVRICLSLMKLRALRKALAEGRDIRYHSDLRKRKKYSKRWSNLFFGILILMFFSMFSSCSSGGPGEEVLQINRLPVLQDLEVGEVALLEDASWPGHGTRVWNYSNLLLQEHYEYEQRGVVRETMNRAADSQSAASVLKVRYYKSRLASTAGPLYRELVENEGNEKTGTDKFTEVMSTEFDSCVIRKEEDKQILIAVTGRQVLLVEYSGGESLIEKMGKLEAMIERD